MTLIEALKSGKRFRRTGFTSYYEPNVHDRYFCHDEILADDWEVEKASVSITREQLYKAYAESLHELFDMTALKPNTGVINLMYQKLGL